MILAAEHTFKSLSNFCFILPFLAVLKSEDIIRSAVMENADLLSKRQIWLKYGEGWGNLAFGKKELAKKIDNSIKER